MNQNILYFGSANEPPKCHNLKSGPISLVYENGFLRHICLGSAEVINMIYFALRDQNWNTFHGSIKNEKIRITKTGFEISFRSVISEGSVQYVFDCLIKASGEKLEFGIRGESFSNFSSNRIGFCVLHSVSAYAGKSCTILSSGKNEINGTFPLIAEPHQVFVDIKSMRWEPLKGWEAELKFDGDTFETEDQRNWSDSTFKTYCTPLSKPFPVEVRMGDMVKQKITLNLKALRKDSIAKIKENPPLSITVGRGTTGVKLPSIGFCDTNSYKDYSESDIRLLSHSGMQHLRCEIDASQPGLNGEVQRIKLKSSALKVPLMLVLVFGDSPDIEVREFINLAQIEKLDIYSIELLNRNSPSTPAELLRKVREPLRNAFPSIKIGGGTDKYFAELNRNRIDPQFIDFLAFPSSPGSHMNDNTTLVENLEGAPEAYKTAISYANGKDVYVSPVSLRVRSKIKSSEAGKSFGDHLPPDVDTRQNSLFGAAWTLGSIKHLAEAGASHITYYETTGWKGIIQGNSPSPAPSLFLAQSGIAFPMYFVFHWLGELAGTEVIQAESSDPGKLTGLALEKNKEKYLMLANHTSDIIEFPVNHFNNAKIISRINEKNAVSFMNDPLSFLEKKKEEVCESSVRMMPFEVLVMKSGK
jgi:hypothetical protein